MTLEELIKSLGLDADESKDKAQILKKEWNSLKKEANDFSKKLEKSNEQLELLKDAEGKLKVVQEAFKLDFNAEDIDAMIDEVKESFTKTKDNPVDKEELKELKREKQKLIRERDALDKQYKEAEAKLTEEKTNRINGKKVAEIRKALDANKIIKPEQMVELFRSKVISDEDGDIFTIAGEDGVELTISEYIADWAKDNSEFVLADVKGGVGSSPLANNSVKPNSKDTNTSSIMQSLLDRASSNSSDSASTAVKQFG